MSTRRVYKLPLYALCKNCRFGWWWCGICTCVPACSIFCLRPWFN